MSVIQLAFKYILLKSTLELNKIPDMGIFGENQYRTNIDPFQYSLIHLWFKKS